MDKPDLIPVQTLDRGNPMVWDGEEAAQGVFIAPGDGGDPLELLGTPSAVTLPEEPRLPADFAVSDPLREMLESLRHSMREVAAGERECVRIELANLVPEDCDALPLMLGKGEVSGALALDDVRYELQEAVTPGLWMVRGSDGSQWLEVGPVPRIVEQAALSLRPAPVPLPKHVPEIMNGLAVLAEVNEHAASWDGTADHNRVLNFTLMPMNPQDQQLLLDVLGRAELTLESGGFGNCQVLATTVRHVWAVQFVNAMGSTILDTLEIGRIPDAVLAAPEDFEDSARRLDQIIGTYLS